MESKSFNITPEIVVGADAPLLIIAGPCQIESLDHSLMIGEKVKEICNRLGLGYVFKSSFDKANRTSLESQRGVGLDEGLKILGEVKSRLNLPVITDVHLPEQVPEVAEVVDILQIPAFLCRQTDLLVAVGESGRAINLKKGQFLHPSDMEHCAKKISSQGNDKIMLCERGTCFGYRDLMVDPRSFILMGKTGYPVIFDATHSVQQMGGAGGSSGGQREFIAPLARAAVAIGVNGVFIECHQDPSNAPSDGPCMLPLNELESVLDSLSKIYKVRNDIV